MSYPKITVVTVNLNNAGFLEETILSVVGQQYPNLEYIIIDGGSTDGSVEIIKKYERHLAYWESEKDAGYGFALQKGFSKSTGEIMAWLNSDDIFLPGSLFAAAEIFQSNPSVQWITGFPSWSSKESFHLAEMPATKQSRPYWAKHYHLYGKYARWSRIRYLGGDFLAIQQESTFWKRELWQQAGGYIDTNYKLAIDTELWCRFFRHAMLYSVQTIFAAFRSGSGNQLTKTRRKEYLEECKKALDQELNKLPSTTRIQYKLRYLLSRPLKLFYYFGLPFSAVYERLLQLPPVIYPGKGD